MVDNEPSNNNLYISKCRLEIFEHRIVQEIFEAAGLRTKLQELRRETDGQTLRLDLFAKRFPAFPIQLAVPAKDPEMNIRVGLMWSSKAKNPIYAAYAAAFGEAPFLGQGYFGLVVSGGPIGLLVMHNDLPRDRTGEDETRFERVYGRRGTRLVFEPLTPVLRGVPANWFGGAHVSTT